MAAMGKSRNSNMELLRIIAMFMIVAVHACMYVPTFCQGSALTWMNGSVNGIANIGVTLFILISGYYGVRCKVSKLVRMECMMIMFSLLETVLLLVFLPEELQGAALLEQLVKSCLPFITRKYWFYSCYVCMMLLSGYIDTFVEALGEKGLRRLLALMLVLFSVFPTVFYFEIIPDNGKGLVQMLMIYLVGRYIRLYKDVQLPRWSLLVFLGLWLVNGFSHEHAIQIGGVYHHLCKDNSITNIAMAVILFYAIKEQRFTSKGVNVLAAQIFAVFALNNALTNVVMRTIQNSAFRSSGGIGGAFLFLVIVAAIMTVCISVGLLRNLLLGRVDDWLAGRVEKYWNRIYERFRV